MFLAKILAKGKSFKFGIFDQGLEFLFSNAQRPENGLVIRLQISPDEGWQVFFDQKDDIDCIDDEIKRVPND